METQSLYAQMVISVQSFVKSTEITPISAKYSMIADY